MVRVGEVYMMATSALSGFDPKPERPVVVVRVPDATIDPADDRVWVVARTTDLHQDGVKHPADTSLRLDRPGVFAERYTRTADIQAFDDPEVARRLGTLDERILRNVLSRFQSEDP